jgi:hypothetical protein
MKNVIFTVRNFIKILFHIDLGTGKYFLSSNKRTDCDDCNTDQYIYF